MKKCISILLTVFLFATLLVGCSSSSVSLTEGKDNEKLHGAWVVINETPGYNRRTIRYWEFKGDNTITICGFVETTDSNTVNDQLYAAAPYDDMYKQYYINAEKAEVETYPYSYTDGYGLEYQKNEEFIVDYVAEKGWLFEFPNSNEFYLTAHDSEVYHGYRLKDPLLR